jgi:tetratricopeptide (TPR) repeat protein
MGDRIYFSRILNSVIAFTIIFLGGMTNYISPILAQNEDEFLDPLEQPVQDPLLPTGQQDLSPLERRQLTEALDNLNAEAQAQLQAEKIDAAFAIWYRELRLRRSLGRLEEINALGRVGRVAWERTRREDVQIILKRLNVVQQQAELEAPLTPELLQTFATAYEQIHSINDSINIQQKILANVRKTGDRDREDAILQKLGQLYLAKFDYPNAAKIYEELLKRSQAQQNTYNEGIYLQQLAEIYSNAIQSKNAVQIKEKLVERYLSEGKKQEIPELKLEIGADYEALKDPEKASQNYQEAFSLAWSLQDFGTAADALIKLGDLYQQHNQEDYALQIYQELIKVNQQSYDYYGLMQTYDRIGQIHLKQNNYPQALAAFQKGLELARSLNYRQDYFLSQIEKINQQQ